MCPLGWQRTVGLKRKLCAGSYGRGILQSRGRAGSSRHRALDPRCSRGLYPFSQSQLSAAWLWSQIILNFKACWVVSICISEPEIRTWPIVDSLSERLITFPSQLRGSIWTIDNNLGDRSCETHHENRAETACMKHSGTVIKNGFSI